MAQSSNAYEGFFRKLNISYVIAGEGALDLALAMAKPQEHFGTDEFVSGGGGVSWLCMKAGLADELSTVLTPVTDGPTGTDPLEIKQREHTPLDGGSLCPGLLRRGLN